MPWTTPRVVLRTLGQGDLADGGKVFQASTARFVDDGEQFVRYLSESTQTKGHKPDWQLAPREWAGAVPGKSTAIIDHRSSQGRHLENNRDFLSVYGPRLGLGWITPCIMPGSEPVRLSRLLRDRLDAGEDLRFREAEGGNWEFRFWAPVGLKVVYSPISQRVVHVECGGCHKCPDPQMTPGNWFVMWEVEFEYEGESRIPSAIEVVENIQKPEHSFESEVRDGYRYVIRNAKVNPELSISASAVVFDKGTLVHDHIRQRIFENGITPEDDEQATLEYRVQHRLIAEDDSRLRPGAPSPERPKARWNGLLLCNGVVLAVIIGWTIVCRRRKRMTQK